MTDTPPILSSALARLPHIRHGFFTRNATGEQFGQRNCAYRPGDDETEVTRNRAACAAALGSSFEQLITVKQRHTSDVITVAAPFSWRDAPVADALVTTTPGLSLGILTADCVPVLLADANKSVIGAAHAGWRGTFDGVLENTVAAMERMGANRAEIIACIGPCIGKTSYEVGPEFLARFIAKDPSFADYFSDHRPNGHCQFDLPRFAADRIKSAGVETVTVSGHDTCTEEALFFSFRRATLRREPDYGRQMSAITLH